VMRIRLPSVAPVDDTTRATSSLPSEWISGLSCSVENLRTALHRGSY
jgi:hypothetical protein